MPRIERELTPIELRLIEQYHKRIEEKSNRLPSQIMYGTMDCPDCAHTMAAFSWCCPVCGWEDISRKREYKYETVNINMSNLENVKYKQCMCDKSCFTVDENGNLVPKECTTWFTGGVNDSKV